MSRTIELVKEQKPKATPDWVAAANAEIAELQAAAAADPKAFFGNRVRGMGDGLTRVRALLYASKNIEQALGQLNRGM